MGKSNYFSSKFVFGQPISLIDNNIIKTAVKRHKSEHYTKLFKSKDHLISMLFCSFAKCTSLREISGKTASLDLTHIPKRSTLSDANKNRKLDFIDKILRFYFLQYTI